MSQKLEPLREFKALDMSRMDFADWAKRDLSDSFEDAFFHFLASLQSKNTRRAYSKDIVEFWEFLKAHQLTVLKVSAVNERMLLSWQHHLSHVHVKHVGTAGRTVQSTIARKLSAVSSLLEFALKRKIIDFNPAKLLKRPKIKRESRTNAFTWPELKQMLAVCEDKRSHLRPAGGREYRSWSLRYSEIGRAHV